MRDTSQSFHERTPAPMWIRLLGYACYALCLVVVIVAIFNASTLFDNAASIVGVVVGFIALAFAGIVGTASAIDMTVSTGGIQIRFRPIRTYRRGRNDIASAHVEQITAASYGGARLKIHAGEPGLLVLGRIRRGDQAKVRRDDLPRSLQRPRPPLSCHPRRLRASSAISEVPLRNDRRTLLPTDSPAGAVVGAQGTS